MYRWNQVAGWLDHPALGAELGVKNGQFTEHMLRSFKSLRMVAVDLWAPLPPLEKVGYEDYWTWDFEAIRAEFKERTEPYADRLTVLRMDTADAAAEFEDRMFDFVFVDAEHTYDGVRDDIRAWWPKVKPGGALCGHDYRNKFPGVKAAVDELRRRVTIGVDSTWLIRVD